MKKPIYSALVFFGTLGILSAGYAGFVTLQTSDADSGKSLTSGMMQAVIGNLADLDSRVSSMSWAVTSLQGFWGTVTGGIGYSGGNVGIGTASPVGKLDVVNSSTATGWVIRASTTGHSNDSGIFQDGSGNMIIGARNGAGTLNISLGTNGWSWINGGNVGIGTTTPQTTLDINGSLRATSQPHIFGSPTNTTGAGFANSFTTLTSRGGMTWSGDRIIVPISWVYLITFSTISPQTTWRVDANIHVNGNIVLSLLSEDNGTGHHQRSGSMSMYLSAGDYIQFSNTSWYDYANIIFYKWRTASVTLLN